MINQNRSWIWLVLILAVYVGWKYFIKPWMEKRYNKRDDEDKKDEQKKQE